VELLVDKYLHAPFSLAGWQKYDGKWGCWADGAREREGGTTPVAPASPTGQGRRDVKMRTFRASPHSHRANFVYDVIFVGLARLSSESTYYVRSKVFPFAAARARGLGEGKQGGEFVRRTEYLVESFSCLTSLGVSIEQCQSSWEQLDRFCPKSSPSCAS
jgi:hypothetical protein